MSVPVPDSGDSLTTQSIYDMDDVARSVVNNIDNDGVGNMALGVQHVPNIVVGADTTRVSSPATVNTFSDPFDPDGSDWQEMTDYEVDGADLPASILVMNIDLRVSAADASSTALDTQFWFMLVYSIDGTETRSYFYSRVVWTQELHGQIEQPVSISALLDKTAGDYKLDYVKLYATGCPGYGTGGTMPDFVIDSGQAWWLALYGAAA